MLDVHVLVFLLEEIVNDVRVSPADGDHAVLDQYDAKGNGEIMAESLGLVLFEGRDAVDDHIVVLVRFAAGSFIDVQRVGYRFHGQLEVLGEIVKLFRRGVAGVYPGMGLDLLGLDENAIFSFVDLQH